MPRRGIPRASGRARAAQGIPPARPDVIVDVLFEDGLLFISVKNIGTRPALSVSVTFGQRVVGVGGAKEISALPLFRNIEFLPPQREIRAFLDTSASYFARKEPTRISAHIEFRDQDGGQYALDVAHDLEIYREIGYVVRPTPSPELDG